MEVPELVPMPKLLQPSVVAQRKMDTFCSTSVSPQGDFNGGRVSEVARQQQKRGLRHTLARGTPTSPNNTSVSET